MIVLTHKIPAADINVQASTLIAVKGNGVKLCWTRSWRDTWRVCGQSVVEWILWLIIWLVIRNLEHFNCVAYAASCEVNTRTTIVKRNSQCALDLYAHCVLVSLSTSLLQDLLTEVYRRKWLLRICYTKAETEVHSNWLFLHWRGRYRW
jgi:hypothetical protein